MMPEDRVADLLREEADAYEPGDGRAGLSRRLRSRRRRRIGWRSALALLVAGGLAAGVAVATGGPRRDDQRVRVAAPAPSPVAPLADPGLTPKGWAPVDVGAVQVSVPSAWDIEDFGASGCDREEGEVFVQEAAQLPASMGSCPVPDVVDLSDARGQPVPHARSVLVNGIRAVRGVTGTGSKRTLIERALGVDVDAQGPLAERVLATLTHSPRSVVLDSSADSSAVTVPRGWREITFGGIRMAVPRAWRLEHLDGYTTCQGWSLPARILFLWRANSISAPDCQLLYPTAGSTAGSPGAVVIAGPFVPAVPAGASCRRRAGLRICVDAGQLGVLTLHVSPPGAVHPDEVEIGLAGTGLQALRIFDSITTG